MEHHYNVYKDPNIDSRCFSCINGWKALEPLNLDFRDVEFVSFSSDCHDSEYDPDSDEGWKYTLKTIIYSIAEEKSAASDFFIENGGIDLKQFEELMDHNVRTVRRKYEVCWQFSDRFGNPARFHLKDGSWMSGPLKLDYVNYGAFGLCNFFILSDAALVDPETSEYILSFREADDTRVKSYRLLGEEVVEEDNSDEE